MGLPSAHIKRGKHMKRSIQKLGLTGWVLLGCCAQAFAGQEVSVGRVEVVLPGEGWQVFQLEDSGNTMAGGGVTSQQTAETKVMAHFGSDKVLDAVILVRANESGKGRFSGVSYPDAKCTGPKGLFSEGDQGGPGARSFKCLQIWRQSIPNVSSGIPRPALEWLTKNGWDFPPTMDMVYATQYANTGAYASMLVYLRPIAAQPVVTQTRDIPSALPGGLVEAIAHWGRELQEAVSDSVYSIRGKLPMPKLEFVDVAMDPPKLPAETKPTAPPVQPVSPGLSERG